MNTFKYEDEKVCLDKFSISEKATAYSGHNWLQYFSVDSLKRELNDAGLSVTDTLGNIAGTEHSKTNNEFAVTAGKKPDISVQRPIAGCRI